MIQAVPDVDSQIFEVHAYAVNQVFKFKWSARKITRRPTKRISTETKYLKTVFIVQTINNIKLYVHQMSLAR